MKKMKIKGLKKAVGDFRRFNAGGDYHPRYGYLMYDYETGKLWTDEFYSLGHSSWIEYDSETIVNLGEMMAGKKLEVNMKNVVEFVDKMWN